MFFEGRFIGVNLSAEFARQLPRFLLRFFIIFLCPMLFGVMSKRILGRERFTTSFTYIDTSIIVMNTMPVKNALKNASKLC